MVKNKYFLYGNGGGIDNVRKNIEIALQTNQGVFNSLDECLEHICKIYSSWLNKSNLSIIHYTYDDRIDYEVFMIVTNRMGEENYIEKYGTPQFVSYLIEL